MMLTEKLQIFTRIYRVWSHFFTDMLLLVNIWSSSNIYWFIGIQICCQQIQMNSYSFTFDICNIRSGIRWAIMKVILNYSPLPRRTPKRHSHLEGTHFPAQLQLLIIVRCSGFGISLSLRKETELNLTGRTEWPQ